MCGPYVYTCNRCMRQIRIILCCEETCQDPVEIGEYLEVDVGAGKICHECQLCGIAYFDGEEEEEVFDGFDYGFVSYVTAAMKWRAADLEYEAMRKMHDLYPSMDIETEVSQNNYVSKAWWGTDCKISSLDTYTPEFTGLPYGFWDVAEYIGEVSYRIRQCSYEDWRNFDHILKAWTKQSQPENWEWDRIIQNLGLLATRGVVPQGTDSIFLKICRERNTWGCVGDCPVRETKSGQKRTRTDRMRMEVEFQVQLQEYVSRTETRKHSSEEHILALFGGMSVGKTEIRAAKRSPVAVKNRPTLSLPQGRGF